MAAKPPATAAPPAAAASTAAAAAAERLASVQRAVEQNGVAVDKLHRSWRGWLQALAYLVLFLSFLQAKAPFAQCLRDEAYTYGEGLPLHLTMRRTLWLAARDTAEYILGMFIAVSWIAFLVAPDRGFSATPWLAATAWTGAMVAVLVDRSRNPRTSCLQMVDPAFTSPEAPAARTFPVVIVYHGIATVCVWVMRMQRRIHQRNVRAVEKLREDVAKSRKKQ